MAQTFIELLAEARRVKEETLNPRYESYYECDKNGNILFLCSCFFDEEIDEYRERLNNRKGSSIYFCTYGANQEIIWTTNLSKEQLSTLNKLISL